MTSGCERCEAGSWIEHAKGNWCLLCFSCARRRFFSSIMNVKIKDPFHISRICRLCLLSDGTMPIFSDNDVKVSLKQKISICLSFEVSTFRII